MQRKIIEIDQEKCSGCGACADACHEGAIGMVNGKAVLLRDDYCDGLGDCLPSCPEDAIHFVVREAANYDEEAVRQNMAQRAEAKQANQQNPDTVPTGCPGARAHAVRRRESPIHSTAKPGVSNSRLSQWPVQIKLAPVKAPFYDGANLLVAADCSAYAYADFHEQFIKNRITLIGCPKLDGVDYTEKLTEILKSNNIKSLTIVRMEVPCCGGLEHAAVNALQASGKFIPWQVVTICTNGEIKED